MTTAAKAAMNSSRERLALKNPKPISITHRPKGVTNPPPTVEISPVPLNLFNISPGLSESQMRVAGQ